MTLAEFLQARITEDEAETDIHHWDCDVSLSANLPGPPAVCDCDYPARVLADCQAKRAIVDRHGVRQVSPSCSECGGYTANDDDVRGITHHGYAIPWPCPTLRHLAAVYADHPDYQQEWAP